MGGLENGVAYQVRVQAHNRAPDPSSWSGWSATEMPAVPPPAVGADDGRNSPVGDQAQLQVTWAPPAANGDAIDGYELQVLRADQSCEHIPTSPAEPTARPCR